MAMATDRRTKRNVPTRRLDRFDQPLEGRRQIRMTMDPETVGKFSERVARFLGSWRFIGYMTAFVASWVLWNTLAPEDLRFDQWPFIGLTLLLSLQASYAAPLILLAQNRQADRDRVAEALESTRKQLSEFEAKILGLYLDGLSCQEIAKAVGKSPKSVDNAVQRVRRKAARQLSSGDISKR